MTLMLSSGLSAIGKSGKEDSLKNVINTHQSDSARIEAMMELSIHYYRSDINQAQTLASQAVDLSSKINFRKGLAYSHFILGKIYGRLNDPKLSLKEYLLSLKVYQEIEDKTYICKIFNNIGLIYKNQADYDEAISYYLKALDLAKQENDLKNTADALNNLGTVYRRVGKYETAIDYFIQALKVKEEMGDKKGVAAINGNLGNLYLDHSEYDKALHYYQAANTLFVDLGIRKLEAVSLSNIGLVYFYKNNLKASLEHHKKALPILTELGEYSEIANCLNDIGSIYLKENNYALAIQTFQQGLKSFKAAGSKNMLYMAETYNNLGELYIKVGDFQSALEYLESGRAIANDIDNLSLKKDIYRNLALFYEKTEDFEKAYLNHKLFTSYKDSIYNLEKTQQIAEIETKYETEKRDQENMFLKNEQARKNAELKRKDLENKMLAGGIILFLIAIIHFYRINKQKKATNKILSEQNKQIYDKQLEIVNINENLKESQKRLHNANSELRLLNDGLEATVKARTSELQKTNNELDTFLYQSSHALRRPLVHINGLMQILRIEEDKIKAQDIFDKLNYTIQKMDMMLSKLVMASEVHYGQEKEREINFEELIKDVWAFLSLKYDTKSIRFGVEINTDLKFLADERMLRIMFQNILENSILFKVDSTLRPPSLGIDITSDSEHMEIKIHDNGIGIPKEALSDIFKMFTVATHKTEGYGLGLYIVNKAVKKLKGTITVSSFEHEYTVFRITIPLVKATQLI
ncbi:tetratricopeptide repeat protein [Flexithrix dorotheae]|uniref:tetratricopeptide repeat protein n=1 Tax=Flexithrix dorotheae TaxID=70993 RepID=UPI00146A36CB|nr:tetratricopeptide repeat protein [Flexithrix dorotheae]